ncbi:PPM-type phosphatase domain-containing protein [Mycena indigotica]|uniref:PPM-type phosphatase domain-containing protein n=1 Tax=Mycena indigotica TaxID=2126181 RepID=A0A8H6SIE2_9AGAR|nr:PPM-type phosphatase domain-containing protein [Mycena indigotica]KAF7299407.1 PPM-type phosphatase domain-containing protein [Mycena indigotica]
MVVVVAIVDSQNITSMSKTVQPGIHQDCLPTKDQDRTVVLPFEHGTIIAIFDGHLGDELAYYASKYFLQLIVEIFDPTAQDLEERIIDTFQYFDDYLLGCVTKLFPGRSWMDSKWDNFDNVYKVIDRDPDFSSGRPTVVGTTVLLGIIDKAKQSIWVVSLGDSCAIRGRMQRGKMVPLIMNEYHNCKNEEEVAKIEREHPGEKDLVVHGGTLGGLRITRALGDHMFKVEIPLASKILASYVPCPIPRFLFRKWAENGNITPPYISCIPSVRKFDLMPGDIVVFASDGLADSLAWPDSRDCWEAIMPLLIGVDDERLGHRCFKPPAGAEVNKAELLIRNVLFGDDNVKMAGVLMDRWRDDISVVVVEVDELEYCQAATRT